MAEPFTLRIHIGDQTKEVSLPAWEDITLGRYAEVARAPKDELDHEVVARILGIDTLDALAMSTKEAMAALNWYWGVLSEGAKAWTAYADILDDLGEEGLTKPGLLQAIAQRGGRITHIDIDGERYIVPEDIEMSTKYGQWVDLEATLDQFEGTEHESEYFPHLLAALCTKEGEVYSEINGLQRRKVFERCRAIDGIRAVAFFFSSSDVFARIMLRRFPNCLAFVQPPTQPVLRLIRPSGESGTT